MLALWKDLEIDLIICPVAPHPVLPLVRWNAIGYTSAFMFLEYPAGVVQAGVVGEEDLKEEVKGELRGVWDWVNRALWGYLRSPLTLQIMTPKGRERRCWEGMKIVEGVTKGESDRRMRARLCSNRVGKEEQ